MWTSKKIFSSLIVQPANHESISEVAQTFEEWEDSEIYRRLADQLNA